MNRATCEYQLIQEKTVVEEVMDKVEEISLEDTYELYEKGFYLELTKDLLDEPLFIVNREED